MINAVNRFDSYAYRVSENLSQTVTDLEEGQWVQTDDRGEVVVADGTKKSFLGLTSQRKGRDQIGGRASRKAVFLHGPFALEVTNFDPAGDYAAGMTPLVVTAGGVLTPGKTPATDIVVAYAKAQPNNGYLKIYSA